MGFIKWKIKKDSEPPTLEEANLFIEELVENLLEMTDFLGTKVWSYRIDKSIDDNSVFKHLNKPHTHFRDCWYFLEEGPDAVQHGFEKFGGLPIEAAKAIWPLKCVEILIYSGMKPDEAMKLMPKFQP